MDTIGSLDACERLLHDAAAELEVVALTFAPSNPAVEPHFRLERLDQLLVQLSGAQSMMMETPPDARSWAVQSRVAHVRAWRYAAQAAVDFAIEALQEGSDSTAAAESCCRYSEHLLAALILLAALATSGEEVSLPDGERASQRTKSSISVPLWDDDLRVVLRRIGGLQHADKNWTLPAISRTNRSLRLAVEKLETVVDSVWSRSPSPPWHLCRYYVEAEAWRIAAETATEFVERETSLPPPALKRALLSGLAFAEESISALLAPGTRFRAPSGTLMESRLAGARASRNAAQPS
ncbi:MAG TPA: hypothetical protein DEV93_05460 [Chloroflexi bacterium]|jgi:hypothetical protein|nr:hypothetical protein [Chloroflexota bacterium]